MQRHRELVERFYDEVINGKRLGVVDEICSPEFVEHGSPGPPPGIDGFKNLLQAIVGAFPDMHLAVEDWVVEGDRVVARMTATATHRGEFLGVPGTGHPVSWTAIHLGRVSDDRLAERWSEANLLAIRDQLG